MTVFDSSYNPVTRRDFMKKSAITVSALTILGRGIGLADPPSQSNSGTLTTVYSYQYRLKCKQAPEFDDGVISWAETKNAQGQASSMQVRLNCSGPDTGESSLSALTTIKATISSDLLSAEATSKSTPTLGIPKDNPPTSGTEKDKYDAYNGQWLVSTGKQAAYFHDRMLEDLPTGAKGVTYNLSGNVATAALNYSGFKFENMNVGQGSVTSNVKTYRTNGATGFSTRAAAKASLDAGAAYSAAASTDKIGEDLSITANGSVGIEGDGHMQSDQSYENKDAGTNNARYDATTNYSSSITGSLKIKWQIVVQKKTKAEGFSNGVRTSSVESDWVDMAE